MAEKEKKPLHKKWWFWVVAILIVGSWIVGNDDEDSTDKVKTETVDKKEDDEKEESSKEEKQKKDEKKKSNDKKDAAKKEEKKEDIPIEEKILEENSAIKKATLEDGYLKLELDGDGSFSVNTMVSNQAVHALDAMEIAFKDEKVDTVGAIVKGTMIDAKGNETQEDIISIYYDRESFEELNFENFHDMALGEPWRIYNESDSYFIHPGIYKDLKDKIVGNLVNGSSKVE